MFCLPLPFSFFFFNDTATTEIYTLSLRDALPISSGGMATPPPVTPPPASLVMMMAPPAPTTCVTQSALNVQRSEEHTSELQSRLHLVCRLLLEKKKK